MFDTETRREVAKIARRLDVPTEALLAVAEVESAGKVTARVRGRDEPLIRFEGHYFDRFLRGKVRQKARSAGLSNPKAGAVKNPRRQADRWALLDKAIKINRIAALSSVSWGLGQVMGSHWEWLGYGSVDALATEARSGAAGQVALMARYIEKAELAGVLRKRDWAKFARTYNGPGYRKNRYDTKMEQAYQRLVREAGRKRLPKITDKASSSSGGQLMFGSRGAGVKKLQKTLCAKGYVLVADGLFGLITDRVVRQFQRDHLIKETGVIGSPERGLLFGKRERLAELGRKIQKRSSNNVNKAIDVSQSRFPTWRSRMMANLRKVALSISKRLA